MTDPADHALTEAERAELYRAFEEFRRGRFTTANTLYAAVERILAARADEQEERNLLLLDICAGSTRFKTPGEKVLAIERVLTEARGGDPDDHTGHDHGEDAAVTDDGLRAAWDEGWKAARQVVEVEGVKCWAHTVFPEGYEGNPYADAAPAPTEKENTDD